MRDGATKSFEQSYNCQAVVDNQAQVIVAAQVTQQANDKQQVKPLVEQMKVNLGGRTPGELSADAGYYSDDKVAHLEGQAIEPFVATGRPMHGVPAIHLRSRCQLLPQHGTGWRPSSKRWPARRCTRKRKETAEPVFGQIKEARGIRRFLLRGLGSVQGEWSLICATHNLPKLFRSGWTPQMA